MALVSRDLHHMHVPRRTPWAELAGSARVAVRFRPARPKGADLFLATIQAVNRPDLTLGFPVSRLAATAQETAGLAARQHRSGPALPRLRVAGHDQQGAHRGPTTTGADSRSCLFNPVPDKAGRLTGLCASRWSCFGRRSRLSARLSCPGQPAEPGTIFQGTKEADQPATVPGQRDAPPLASAWSA